MINRLWTEQTGDILRAIIFHQKFEENIEYSVSKERYFYLLQVQVPLTLRVGQNLSVTWGIL